MNEDLKTIFTNVNDWLKYAETKNATLTAFNGAAIFGLLQGWSFVPHPLVVVNVLFLTISSLLSIISFTPRTSRLLKTPKINPREWSVIKNTINILFFGDISKLTSSQFIELYTEHTQPTNYQPTNIDRHLVDQILINAEIALNKNRWFRHAVRITIVLILLNLLFISTVIWGWMKH